MEPLGCLIRYNHWKGGHRYEPYPDGARRHSRRLTRFYALAVSLDSGGCCDRCADKKAQAESFSTNAAARESCSGLDQNLFPLDGSGSGSETKSEQAKALLIAAPFVGLPDKAKLAQNISHLSSQEAHQGVTFAWTPIAPDRLAVHFNDAWQQSHGQLIDRAGFYDLSGQYYDHFVAQRLHAGYSYVAAHRCEVDLFLVDHQITRRTWTDYVVAES
jgi:hypothetical protein